MPRSRARSNNSLRRASTAEPQEYLAYAAHVQRLAKGDPRVQRYSRRLTRDETDFGVRVLKSFFDTRGGLDDLTLVEVLRFMCEAIDAATEPPWLWMPNDELDDWDARYGVDEDGDPLGILALPRRSAAKPRRERAASRGKQNEQRGTATQVEVTDGSDSTQAKPRRRLPSLNPDRSSESPRRPGRTGRGGRHR